MELTNEDRDKVLELAVKYDKYEVIPEDDDIIKEDMKWLIDLIKSLDEGWPE